MSFLDKLKQKTEAMKEIAADFIADDIVIQERLVLCNSCPELKPTFNVCGKCGCFVATKTKIKSASCPLNKW